MAVDARARQELHHQLEASLGASAAGTLMTMLPAVYGGDVATKDDIARLESRFDALEARCATKDDLARFATKDDLARCATKDDLARFATKDDLARFEARWEHDMTGRFAAIDGSFRAIDTRFLAIDTRFLAIEDRLIAVDDRLIAVRDHLEGALLTGLAGVRTEVAAQSRSLMLTFLAVALSFGGLILAAVQLA